MGQIHCFIGMVLLGSSSDRAEQSEFSCLGNTELTGGGTGTQDAWEGYRHEVLSSFYQYTLNSVGQCKVS